MSVLLMEPVGRPLTLFDDEEPRPATPPQSGQADRAGDVPGDGVGGESTLDGLVVGAWEGLAARAVVHCPVCDGPMRPRGGAGPLPVGGRCERCGTTLA